MRFTRTITLWIYLSTGLWVGCSKPDAALHQPKNALIRPSFAEQWEAVVSGNNDQVIVDDAVVTNDAIAPMQPTDSLVTLVLDGGKVTDVALRTVGECSQLQHLRLRMSPITDDGMKEIANLSELRILNLPHAECTAAGIRVLSKLMNLRQLRLGSKIASGDVCRPISEIQSLTAVHLINIPIQDDDLLLLAKLPRLHSLYIDGAEISDSGWTQLFRECPHLHVHVNNRHHDLDPERDPR